MLKRSIPSLLFTFFAGLLLFPAAAQAQRLDQDSLKRAVEKAASDTARINALLVLANYQIKHERQDSAGLQSLREATALSDRISFPEGLARAQMITGNYYRSKNDWDQSLSAYQKMIDICSLIPDDSLKNTLLMMAYNNTGGIYNTKGDFNNSLRFRLKAMELAEQFTPDNYNNLAIIYLNIASDYRMLKVSSKAIAYLDRTTSFFSRISDRLKMEYYYEYHENYLATDSMNAVQRILQQFRNGIRDYDLSAFQKKDYSLVLEKFSGNFEADYKKNYAAAMKHFQQYRALAEELDNKRDITESLARMGETSKAMNRLQEAGIYFRQSYDTALAAGLKNLQLNAALLLSQTLHETGQNAEAYTYAAKALSLKDELYDEEIASALAAAEEKYQNQKKEKEIAELRVKNTEKELAVIKRNRWLLIGGISAGLLLLISGLLYRSSKQKQLLAEKENFIRQEHIRFLERQQQVVSLQSMITGQETERTRIAKDLHDGLGGLFSTVKMYFSTLQHEKAELRNNPAFLKSYELIDTAADEVRRIAHNMMPEVLIKLGLVHALQDMCGNISAGKLLQVRLQAYGMEKRLNPDTEVMLYRIVQELMNNIIKHASAREALIQFNRNGNRLHVTVEDNGRGFNLQTTDDRQHAGLETVKSRVDYLNGNISIDSRQDIGTTVMMEFLINE